MKHLIAFPQQFSKAFYVPGRLSGLQEDGGRRYRKKKRPYHLVCLGKPPFIVEVILNVTPGG